MTRLGMVVDIGKCNGCYNCFLACKDEYCGNDFLPYSVSQPMTGHFWMKIVEKERGKYPKVKVAYTAIPCMHCKNPTCIEIAKDGAVYKRSDGIVIIDPIKSVGQKELITSCPYMVIYWNEEKQVPQKCTMCAHLLDEGYKEPRCVEACPTGALIFGDLDDPDSEISKFVASGKTESLHPEYRLDESIRYAGLVKTFVAGSVIFKDNDSCAEGVKITLKGNGDKRETLTNNFGDFEFEDLPKDSSYTVTIEAQGYKKRIFKVKTNIDVYLGDIFISPKQRGKVNG